MTINSLIIGTATCSVLSGGAVAIMPSNIPQAQSADAAAWKPVAGRLTTPWTAEVTPAKALPEYPRPQHVRGEWSNLNGLWDLAVTPKDAPKPARFDKRILVPFAVESALSGVGHLLEPAERLWYRRSFTVPEAWKGKRVILRFEAVDWETTVSVNGKTLETHRGGYDPFFFDITDLLVAGPNQEVVVSVWDPTDKGDQPLGKQVLHPGGCFYTRVSGIWQTVWIEAVPAINIGDLVLVPDVDKGVLRVTVSVKGAAAEVRVSAVAAAEGKPVATVTGKPGETLELPIPTARLWSPDSPFLYDLDVSLSDSRGVVDSVRSYFAMRKIAVGPDEKGVTRILINGKPVFHAGPLDQGWWPDGLHTPPSDAAMLYDLEMMKKFGFNMIRKHIKVEPRRWYWHCDRLGLMVWQDMPSLPTHKVTEEGKVNYARDLDRMIAHLISYPCIVMWIPFNEGWGQHDTEKAVARIRELDPSRLINNASGWTDKGVGDIFDIHSYPVPGAPKPSATRASVVGEYGGLGYQLPEHMWVKSGWGYQSFSNPEELMRKYEDLGDVLWKNRQNPGISGAVYTQVSDVEGEINGLMTYDRKVVKLDPERSALSLKGCTPPRLLGGDMFIGSGTCQLQCVREDAEIRYTVDGSEPTRQSPLYAGPVSLDREMMVKARAFWLDGAASGVVAYHMKRSTARKAISPPVMVKPGLLVKSYEVRDTKLPDYTSLTPVKTGTAMKVDQSARPRMDHYGLVFEGYLTVPETAVYDFNLLSDDGARLWIDGVEVCGKDGIHGMEDSWGTIALEAGVHAITVHYLQAAGGQGLRLEWQGNGMKRHELPAAVLSHPL